jgi:signal peptidase I
VNESAADRPRRAWVAAVLAFLLTGLGHVYAGRPGRGAVLWLLTCATGYLGLYAVVLLVPSIVAVLAFMCIWAAVWIWTIFDAARSAKAAPVPYSLRPYNRWYFYTAIFLVWAMLPAPPTKKIANQNIGGAFKLPSESMAPAYQAGDFIIVTPLRGQVPRGAVVVFRSDFGPLLKRVVGVPGDTLSMRNNHLVVNGAVVAEPYAMIDSVDHTGPEFEWQRTFLTAGVDTARYQPSLHTWGPIAIPRGEYFVLGDSRGNSLDSRYTGFVQRDSITARPSVIYFSWDSERHRVRWSRLGRAPEPE